MRMLGRQPTTRGFLVLAVLLASLCTGGLVASTTGEPAHGLATSRAQPGVQPPAPLDRALAFRPVQQPAPQGRAAPLLLGALAALTAAHRLLSGWLRPCPARGCSLVRSCPPAARAPPHLQPA